jgi:hypothetical protein
MRFVPIKRRDVKIWSGGVEPLALRPTYPTQVQYL